MNPISAILVAWLIVLTIQIWRRRDVIFPQHVLPGRVVEVRAGRFAGEPGFSPLVAYEDGAGRARVIETSIYAPSRAWSVGDEVEVVVDRRGDADVFSRPLMQRMVIGAYAVGLAALAVSAAVAPHDEVAATNAPRQTAALSQPR